MITQANMQMDKMMGKNRRMDCWKLPWLIFAVGILEYCLRSNRAVRAPSAKSALRKPIVLVSDQTASKVLPIRIIKALKSEKERFEPIGFI